VGCPGIDSPESGNSKMPDLIITKAAELKGSGKTIGKEIEME